MMARQEAVVRRLVAGDETGLDAFLQRHAATSMFLRSNLRKTGFRYEGKAYESQYFAALTPKGKFLGVVAHSANGNLLVQAPAALDALADHLKVHLERPIAGMLGPAKQVDRLLEQFQIAGNRLSLNADETVYRLDLTGWTAPDLPADEAAVEAGKVNPDRLAKWLLAYNIEALGAKPGPELEARTEKEAHFYGQSGRHWALLKAGDPVSLCGFNATVEESVQIGPVWTPPPQRNQGYARRLVAASLVIARKRGAKSALLFTDNPPAIRAYTALGFEPIDRYKLAFIEPLIAGPKV